MEDLLKEWNMVELITSFQGKCNNNSNILCCCTLLFTTNAVIYLQRQICTCSFDYCAIIWYLKEIYLYVCLLGYRRLWGILEKMFSFIYIFFLYNRLYCTANIFFVFIMANMCFNISCPRPVLPLLHLVDTF